MDKMDKNSKPFKDGRYKELFDAAESSNIVGEEAVRYNQSLSHLREIENGFVYQYEEGKKEGIEQGIEQEKRNTARKLKAAGTDIDFISLITGLSQEMIIDL